MSEQYQDYEEIRKQRAAAWEARRKRRNLWRAAYSLVILLAVFTLLIVFVVSKKYVDASDKDRETEIAVSTPASSETAPSGAVSSSGVPEETKTAEVPPATESEKTETTPETTIETTPETTEETEPDPTEGMSPDEIRRYQAIAKFTNLGAVKNVNNYLNVRTRPTTESEVCGVIFGGCCAELLEHENGWYKISSGGAAGYVSDQFIATGEEARKIAMDHCRYVAIITAETTPVMDQPDKNSPVLTPVVQGDHYDCLEELDGWIGIDIVADKVGYIDVNDCEVGYFAEEGIIFTDAGGASPLRRNIINTALQYYGGKYVFGGESLTDGIDCSAFTQQIFAKNGITLSRNSWTQAGEGVHVELKDLRPGDLVFYPASHRDGIGHVAIYMGNAKIIHAASERLGITVSDLKIIPILESRDVIGNN